MPSNGVEPFLPYIQEARCMVKVRKAGVETPCLYLIDSANTKIYMERVDGVTAKTFFLENLHSEFSNASLPPK